MTLCSRCSEPVRPVVAFDIDGTLSNYHGHLMTFAQNWLGIGIPHLQIPSLEYKGGEPYGEWFMRTFGVDRATFRAVKLAYRQGGMKRTQPVVPGAKQLVREARDEGAEVWLTTTRPHDRFDRVDPDTREWLRRNLFNFDGLLYSDTKMEDLAERVDPSRVVAVLDDQVDILTRAQELFPDASIIMAAGTHNTEAKWGGIRREVRALRPRINIAIRHYEQSKEQHA